MDLFRREHLSELARHRQNPCLSMFLPLETGGPEKKQNRIRLKNLLQEAEKQLEEMDLRPNQIDEFLEPARELLEELPYWKQDSDGLAVFLSPEMFRYYRLPAGFEELAVVTEQFHIRPLLPLLTEDGRYYVLALSQNNVRFLQCTRHSHREMELKDAPDSLSELLQYEADTETLQFHWGAPERGSHSGGMVFHGQADEGDKAIHKKKVVQFVHQVENGVDKLLGDQRAPLVLAGVEEIRAIYRGVNQRSDLMEDGIEGNPDRVPTRQLRQEAWEVVRPHFEETKQKAVGAYQRFAGTERGSDDLDEILEAADAGRVQILLTDLNRHEWGRYDPGSGLIRLHYREEGGDEDLLDLAAVQTLLHGGIVFALCSEEMPGGCELAAVFRY